MPLDLGPQLAELLAEFKRARRWQLTARTALLGIGAISQPPRAEELEERRFDAFVATMTGSENLFAAAAAAAAAVKPIHAALPTTVGPGMT
jgi:hypothetical protein